MNRPHDPDLEKSEILGGLAKGEYMERPTRKSARLKKYDYSSPGAYFVTICTKDRRCILSSVRRGDPCGRPELELTQYGTILVQCLQKTEASHNIRLSPNMIMPNHVHFICWIDGRATARVAPTLGMIVGSFKSLSANLCREAGLRGPLWQRSFYDHVVRNEEEYREIAEYINANPARWNEDRFYPTE